jgi:beta-N-acetylhexosaminidase
MKIFRKFFVYFLVTISSHVFADQENSWAQRTLQKMSQDEKIGQLFMIAGYVDPEFAEKEVGNPQIIQEIDNYIKQYSVGGIAYVGPSEYSKQIALTNHYQQISKYPILIAQDLEWGLSMRIKDGMGFPKNITLGAIQDDQLLYEMGKEIGNQARLIGVHMNLSPVIDVNIEPENIVINVRSFGSSPQLVAEKGVAMIRGLQDAGIIASAKHFPGLGDITIDPHLCLPYSSHEKTRLTEVELYPFTQAIKAGVLSIQTEHLIVPALEPDRSTPSSLSSKVVNDLLKSELGFTGLVLSGALRMKALTNNIPEEDIVLKAFLAGNDMLLMPNDFPKAFQTIKRALAEGKIIEKELNERVLKILQIKEKIKLNHYAAIPTPTFDELHSSSAKELKKTLFYQAVSVIKNHQSLIPSSFSKKNTIAYVQLGNSSYSKNFAQILNKWQPLDSFNFPLEHWDEKEEQLLLQVIKKYSLIILAVYPLDPRRIADIRLLHGEKQKEELKHFRVHGMSQSFLHVINKLQPFQDRIIVAFFGNPFGLHFFDDYSSVIMAYEPDPDAEEAAANLIFKSNI